MNNEKVTLFVCTPNAEAPLFKRYLAAVKKYTRSPYELMIVDNNYGKDFRHAREMNRALSVCRTRFLVFMDDDVIVTPGWLEGLLHSALHKRASIVGCVHRDTTKKIEHVGGFIGIQGKAGHFCDMMKHAVTVPYVCSAVMLVDVPALRKKNIFFDEQYEKYYHDADICLTVWQKGLRVICTPKADIIHIGSVNTVRPQGYHTRDLERFQKQWIRSGKLKRMLKKNARILDCGTYHEMCLFQELTDAYCQASSDQKNGGHDLRVFQSIAKKARPLQRYFFGRQLIGGAYFHMAEIYISEKKYRGACALLKQTCVVMPAHRKAHTLLRQYTKKQ